MVTMSRAFSESARACLYSRRRLVDLGAQPAAVLLGFAQGAAHGGHEPFRPVLEDVIRGAGLESLNRRLLANGSGNQQNGRLRCFLLGELDRLDAVVGKAGSSRR